MKGKGEADAVIYKVIELLPEYEHDIQVTPTKRVFAIMKKEENHCKSGLFKNREREQFIEFAKHNQFYFPYGLSTHKSHEALFRPFVDERGYIDLKSALAKGEFTLAINQGQSYGEKIDTILKQHQDSIKFKSFGSKMRSELIKQLYKNYGFQATLAIPEEISYNVKHQELEKNQLLYYPVQGTERFEPEAWGYIGCSKSTFGKEVIGKINQHIDAIRAVAVEKYRNFLDEHDRKLHIASEKTIFQGE